MNTFATLVDVSVYKYLCRWTAAKLMTIHFLSAIKCNSFHFKEVFDFFTFILTLHQMIHYLNCKGISLELNYTPEITHPKALV